MSSQQNTQRLKTLMDAHSLSIDDVAALLSRKRQTVKGWRCRNAHTISESHLALLEQKLAARSAQNA